MAARADLAGRGAASGGRRAGRAARIAAALPTRDPFAIVGVTIYLLFILVAVFADQLATHDPLEILFTEDGKLARSVAPGAEHYLGTTHLGRDIYSQLIHGSRGALIVGVSAAIAVVTIGTVVGLVAGYFGGAIDNALMRLADIALGIPFLPFVIVLAAMLEPSMWNVVLGIALLLWPNTGRVIRSQVLSLRERAFVEAARVTGANTPRILFVHIAPNIMPLALLYGSIAVGWAILTEAAISFLGFGPSDTVTWGYMLQDAYASQALSRGSFYWFVPPGICIILIVVAGFFISRGYEEILFPKLKDSPLALLSIQDLRVQYRTDRGVARAVDGASFDVPKGAVVGLVGESGCGKTTAVRAIMRVMPGNARIVGGRILFDGVDLVGLGERDMAARRWREISYIPQSAMNSLDPVYRVGTQLVEVLTERGGMGRSEAEGRAAELFEMVGLERQRLRDYPHQFSGGMRQRAAIALALALEPRLVIADEPVTALDVVVQRQVLDTFKELQQRLGLSVILVTHDVSVVAYVCDLVVVMYAGQVVEAGPVATVLGRPAHPYTMGLYNAFPDLERSGHVLAPIDGTPPDLTDPPEGCRFAARCPFAIERCAEAPPLETVGHGHRAACWRVAEAEELRRRAAKSVTWEPA